MSSYSRQTRSWNLGYSPTTSTTGSSYGRYSSSDYGSKYSTGSYRRPTSTSDYSSKYSSGTPTSSDYASKYGSTRSSTSDHYRLGSSVGSSVGSSGGSSSSSAAGYRRYSGISDYTRRYETTSEYDRHRSSEFRKKSVDALGDPRGNSVSDYDTAEGGLRTFRTRRGSAAADEDGEVKRQNAEQRHSYRDDDSEEAACESRRNSQEDAGSCGSGYPVRKRKSSTDSKRKSVGSDYNEIAEEDNDAVGDAFM
ncbi:hypothetical protein ACOMHN_045295 [Nucella lapillus]